MAEGNITNPSNKGALPSAIRFQRRTNNYNIPLTNEVPKVEKNQNNFVSIDGRRFTTRDQVFKANQEYYQKMTSQGKNNFMK